MLFRSIVYQMVGVLAVGFDLPQRVWGLLVESGFTTPFSPAQGYWYAFALGCPAAVFCFSFAFASLATSRAQVAVAWLFGLIASGAVLGISLLTELFLWGRVNGYVALPVLLAASAGIGLAGYIAYQRKEGISRPTRMQGGRGWIVIAIVVVALLLVLAFYLVAAPYHTELNQAERSSADRASAATSATERSPNNAIPTTMPSTSAERRLP